MPNTYEISEIVLPNGDICLINSKILVKNLSISAEALPQTFYNQTGVETDMVCIKAELGTPSAQISRWEVNTNVAGQIVISGSKAANATTTLKLYLVKSR